MSAGAVMRSAGWFGADLFGRLVQMRNEDEARKYTLDAHSTFAARELFVRDGEAPGGPEVETIRDRDIRALAAAWRASAPEDHSCPSGAKIRSDELATLAIADADALAAERARRGGR